MNQAPHIVTVTIAGEEYNIRAQSTPEYARDCAAYVDARLTEIMQHGSLVQAHKAAILAALALTDELFQARRDLDALRAELRDRAAGIVSQIEGRLAPASSSSA